MGIRQDNGKPVNCRTRVDMDSSSARESIAVSRDSVAFYRDNEAKLEPEPPGSVGVVLVTRCQ